MTEEKKELSVQEENLPAVDEAEHKKTGLVRGARDFIESTFANLKGKDLNQAVEEFSSEMTLVAEGLSEDQARLRQDVDQLSAQHTLLEEKLRRRDQDMEGALDDLGDSLKQLSKHADALDKTLEGIEKQLKEAAKKPQKMGLGQILRQATWMVGIVCGAWVIVTVLKLIGR